MAVSGLKSRARGEAGPTLRTSANANAIEFPAIARIYPPASCTGTGEEGRGRCVRESVACNLTRERAFAFFRQIKRSMPDRRVRARSNLTWIVSKGRERARGVGTYLLERLVHGRVAPGADLFQHAIVSHGG